MPTEVFAPAMSSKRVRMGVAPDSLQLSPNYSSLLWTINGGRTHEIKLAFLDQIYGALLTAGWFPPTEQYQATAAWADQQIGFPVPSTTETTPPPVMPVVYRYYPYVCVNGVPYAFYDPYREEPGGDKMNHNYGGVIFRGVLGYLVPLGTTSNKSLEYLIQWINETLGPEPGGLGLFEASGYIAADGRQHLVIGCLNEMVGLAGNAVEIWAHPGMVGIHAAFHRGGLILWSQPSNRGSTMTAWIYDGGGDPGSAFIQIHPGWTWPTGIWDTNLVSEQLAQNTIRYHLPIGTEWWLNHDPISIVANPHQFAIFVPSKGDAGEYNTTQIMVSCPWVDPRNSPEPTYCLFGSQQFREDLLNLGHDSRKVIALSDQTLRLASSNPVGGSRGMPGICMSRYDSDEPLLTSEGKPLIQNAYLFLPDPGAGQEGRIVGQLYDTVAISDAPSNLDATMRLNGHTWALLSRNTKKWGASRTSLWLAID